MLSLLYSNVETVSLNQDELWAADAFAARHGSHPEHVVDYGGYLWLGPVPGLEGSMSMEVQL